MNKNKETERAELHSAIWRISDDLRGSVDMWDFKTYVLGMLFYRFISENLTQHINARERRAGRLEFDYATLSDADAEFVRDETVAEKGFFILPSELFASVRKCARSDENLCANLPRIFAAIENSASGSNKFKGLFDDLDISSRRLGLTTEKRNEQLVKLLEAFGDLPLSSSGDFSGDTNDTIGDAYEYLIQRYASTASKSAGEFYTPKEVSRLLASIAVVGKSEVRKVYDPTCGSGSLLLSFIKVLGRDKVRQGFYGQEINPTAYNLCRINMLLHDVPIFNIAHGDTLMDPVGGYGPFDAIVSNPPYSLKWDGDANPLLLQDPRFAPVGVLAPKLRSDLAFVLHCLSWLAVDGTAAILQFPGVLYRGGAEQTIRQYLIDNNFIDAVIQLPSNLFTATSVATCILVLKKAKRDNAILFIDAFAEFKRVGSKNVLTQAHQQKILNAYIVRKDITNFSRLVENSAVAAKGYDVYVQNYVSPKIEREVVDIDTLNGEIQHIWAQQVEAWTQLDDIVAGLEERGSA